MSGRLNETEQLVIRLRYGIGLMEELTQQRIADQLGVSRERVSQIESKALKKLRNPMEYPELLSYWEESCLS